MSDDSESRIVSAPRGSRVLPLPSGSSTSQDLPVKAADMFRILSIELSLVLIVRV